MADDLWLVMFTDHFLSHGAKNMTGLAFMTEKQRREFINWHYNRPLSEIRIGWQIFHGSVAQASLSIMKNNLLEQSNEEQSK